MHCGVCHKNVATVSLAHVVDGVSKEWRLCQTCAAKHGVDTQLPLPALTDFLFGLAEPNGVVVDDCTCTACHMHEADFHKTSLLGCPACYVAFQPEVDRLIAGMHKGPRHFGKVPKRQTIATLQALETAIADAVSAQDPAGADHLRRRLHDLVRRSSTLVIRAAAVTGLDGRLGHGPQE